MQSLFPCFSPRVLPVLPTASLFLPKIGIYSNSLYCLTFQDFRCIKGLKPLILCGFLSSRDFSENLFSSLKVGITTPTRNQFAGNCTWVRIPPAAPRRSKLRSTTPTGTAERLCLLAFVPLRLLLLSNPKPEASGLCFWGFNVRACGKKRRPSVLLRSDRGPLRRTCGCAPPGGRN